jgi:hypothetical protein
VLRRDLFSFLISHSGLHQFVITTLSSYVISLRRLRLRILPNISSKNQIVLVTAKVMTTAWSTHFVVTILLQRVIPRHAVGLSYPIQTHPPLPLLTVQLFLFLRLNLLLELVPSERHIASCSVKVSSTHHIQSVLPLSLYDVKKTKKKKKKKKKFVSSLKDLTHFVVCMCTLQGIRRSARVREKSLWNACVSYSVLCLMLWRSFTQFCHIILSNID